VAAAIQRQAGTASEDTQAGPDHNVQPKEKHIMATETVTTDQTARAAAFAATLAAATKELVSAAEDRVREETAQRIARILMESPARPAAAADAEELPRDVKFALSEARLMSEAISAIVREAIDGAGQMDFPMLQAVSACLARLDNAVEPVFERIDGVRRLPADAA
jgi:hypothetical protein